MPGPLRYDALLLISFGGPEGREDVIPFLENVLRGRNVPRERLLAVAEHYYHFGGVSPINQHCRDLIAALTPRISLPIYWGNRNWRPFLADTVREMRDRGVKRALALTTSAFGSYSGCRQYGDDITAARAAVPDAPDIEKIPPFWSDSGFIGAMSERLGSVLDRFPGAEIVFTAHSIPVVMAESSPYVAQLTEAARLALQANGVPGEPRLVFQSRSGPPTQPWLEPDIGDWLRQTEARRVAVVPIGFLSDHMEVIYDLDLEAAAIAKERGIEMARVGTVNEHPAFVNGLAQMIERLAREGLTPCAPGCCPPPLRPRPVRE